jgi:hypothetical protein
MHKFENTKDPRLFRANVRESSKGHSYYLLKISPSQAIDKFTAADAWCKPDLAGWYIFTSEAIERESKFADNATDYLARKTCKDVRIIWIPFPDIDVSKKSVTLEVANPYGKPTTSGVSQIILGNVKLSIGRDNPIYYNDDLGVFQIANKNRNFAVQVAQATEILKADDEPRISIPVFSEAVGSVLCPLSFTRKWIWRFGCELRYFCSQEPPSKKLTTLRFPIFDLASPDPLGNPSLKLMMTLSPFDVCSRATDWVSSMVFLKNTTVSSIPSFFRTVTGTQVKISPQENISRLRFLPSPKEQNNPDDQNGLFDTFNEDVYLTLDGPYNLTYENDEPSGELLCGLFGTEKIRMANGDILHFEPLHPAFFKLKAVSSNDKAGEKALLQDLDARMTTSWVSVAHISPKDKPLGDDADSENLGYYAQANSSPYFGSSKSVQHKANDPATLMVMDAWVSRLSASSALPAVPMVPFSGIDAVGDSGQKSPNRDISFNIIVRLENEVLSPVRRTRMPARKSGPTFLVPNIDGSPRIEEKEIPKSGGQGKESKGLTPQGILAFINDEAGNDRGRWVELVLSKSNIVSDDENHISPYLSFTAAQTDPSASNKYRPPLDPVFVNGMMASQLFLVITDPAHIGKFNSLVSIDGFTFDLDIVDWDKKPGTVLIFKFHQQSIKTLAADTASWSQPLDFNGNQEKVKLVQQYIANYIDGAEQALNSKKHPDLSRFCQCVEDENWNGILALNVPVDATEMPKEIVGLMGGMDKPLKGHHVQIEVNQIKGDGPIDLDNSSLYGLIQYPLITGPTAAIPAKDLDSIQQENSPDVDYKVTNIEVAFENGSISNFHCSVALIIQKLFGRKMIVRNHSSSIIELHGKFQTQNGSNIFSFENPDTTFLTNPTDTPDNPRRVVDRVRISDAVFSTISTTAVEDITGNQDVKARFSLKGGIAFIADILKMDLFGYGGGKDNSDLAFSDLCLDVDFRINKAGEQVKDPPKKVTFNPASLSFSQAKAGGDENAARPGSLPASLPFELNAFKYDPDGLTANKMGGKPVHIKFDTSNDSKTKNYDDLTTPAPQYALEFILPLGSLGSLSSVHVALDAHITVGWGPSPVMKDWDAVSMSVQLPELTPGFKGMSLQGVLKTVFGSANLLHMKKGGENNWLYALAFNNVQLSLFGIGLPPGIMLDLFLFADVNSDTGSKSNLGWLLAYSGDNKEQKSLLKETVSNGIQFSGTIEQAVDSFAKKETIKSLPNTSKRE